MAEELEHNLKYYNYLEPVTRRLNAPGAGNFVRSKEFSEMLARLDECLEYMALHVGQIQHSKVLLLIQEAASPRSSYLHVPLQTTNDERLDFNPSPFCWWAT